MSITHHEDHVSDLLGRLQADLADASALSLAFGSRVLTTHLAKNTGVPAKALAYDRGVALWLRDFPVFQQALVDGVFCRNHVLELKDLDNPSIHGLLVRDQQMLVDAAHDFDWVQWKQIVCVLAERS